MKTRIWNPDKAAITSACLQQNKGLDRIPRSTLANKDGILSDEQESISQTN